MTNHIKLMAEFWFRGEHLIPQLSIDLDALMAAQGKLPDFYPLLANENGIGLYSYEYEMLLAESLQVQVMHGWVADFVSGGVLDIAGFEQRWHECKELKLLQQVAQQFLGVEVLAQAPDIKAALQAAYRHGRLSVK